MIFAKKMKGKLNTCVNFHQTQGLSFLSLASSWPPSWKTTTEEFTAGSHSQLFPDLFVGLQDLFPVSQTRARNSNKMADNCDKNVNILSRFSKLPDRNQATVLVSLETFFSLGKTCFFPSLLFKVKLSPSSSVQFVGLKGIGKHRIARSLLGIHTDFSLQM